jgi:hypothetical protein
MGYRLKHCRISIHLFSNLVNQRIAVMRLYKSLLNMAVIGVLALAGCGGGGDSTVATVAAPVVPAAPVVNVTGKFIDATVAGMAYKCGVANAVTGTTTANGEYTCPAGQPVAFYVGDILIGSVSSPMAVVTPLDLVGAGATPANTTVANIVRFLMSLSSTDPALGAITITPAVTAAATGKTADFTASATTALDALIAALKPGATVYTSAQASTHVSASIQGLFAGSYAGTFSGSNAGTWNITINTSGVVAGTAVDSNMNYAVSGNIATTLSTGSTYAFTGDADGVPWVGTLNISTKVFSGTWNDGAGSSGTFTGK